MIPFTVKNTWSKPEYQRGWGNGYVAIPPSNPWHKVYYDSIPVSVHGGLTFSELGEDYQGSFMPDNIPNDYWIIGFDTSHGGDTLDNWPQFEVEKEILSLLTQLYMIEDVTFSHSYVVAKCTLCGTINDVNSSDYYKELQSLSCISCNKLFYYKA